MYDQLRESIKIDPKFQKQYERVIAAGMQILVSKETSENVVQLAGSPPTPQGVANAIAKLIQIIKGQAKGRFPHEVVIPAASYLLTQLVQMLEEGGEEAANQDLLAEAFVLMVRKIMVDAGATPEKLKAFLAQGRQNASPQEEPVGVVEGAMQ